jgi:hypothetical protein
MRLHLAATAGAVMAAALGASPAFAQVPLVPRALGMGGTIVAGARGQEALFENPANLGLPGTPYWSVAFPQIAAGTTILGLDVNDLRDLRNYDDVSPARAAELLAAIPNGTDVQADLRIPIAAISVGHTAVGVSYGFQGNHSIGHDIVDLFLNGYQPGRTNYSVGNTAGQRSSYIDVALGHGRRFGPVSLGATGHYYIGRSVSSARLSNPTYCATASATPVTTVCAPATVTVPQDVNVTYENVRSTGGHGFGLDVGAAFQPVPTLTLSAAVANVASSMKWNKDLRSRRLVLNRNDFEHSDFLDVSDRYDQSETDYNAATASAIQQALAANLFDGTDFSRVVKLGAAWQALPRTQVAADYRNRLDDSRLQGLWAKSLSVGVEQRIPVVTLRVGAATDMDKGSMLTAGLGLGPLTVGVGRLNNGSSDGVDRKGWVATFGLSGHSNAMP